MALCAMLVTGNWSKRYVMSNQLNLRHCESCLVYNSKNRPMSEGRVLGTGSSTTIILSNPNLRETEIQVIVDFRDSVKGVVRCLCDLNIRRNVQVGNATEMWAADCVVVKVLKTIQRHMDLRVPVNMSALCVRDGSKIFRVNLINISAGGMLCKTNVVMTNGTHFNMEYTFSDVLCKLDARVLHGRRKGNDYVYGCEFYDIPSSYAQAIRKFVMSTQRKAM